MKRWFDFLESQGVKSYRNMYTEIWSQLYPETDLASYASDVKHQLVEEILNTELVGRPGSTEQKIQIMNLYEKVLKTDEKNSTWHNATFMTYEDPQAWVKWAVDIAENAYSLTPVPLADVDTGPLPLPSGNASNDPPMEFAEDTEMAEFAPLLTPTEDKTNSPLEILNPSSKNMEGIGAEGIKEIRTAPLESAFQQFRENQRFSPQRLDTAMQTLNRYGPAEGIRRLKESDPEMATHVERFIEHSKETVK